MGLSPRVRGNRICRQTWGLAGRSIPARAGEPADAAPVVPSPPVYPRACGGTRYGRIVDVPRQGLSPRVRGNQVGEVDHDESLGSIPARAGEPGTIGDSRRRLSVYPRACGGTLQLLRADAEHPGLSPRVRGNRCRRGVRGMDGRSIPARAGEPWTTAPVNRSLRVYPRACGGTRVKSIVAMPAKGLSPRVRGNQPPPHPDLHLPGSIPARAGEPQSACMGTT